jgi:beta-lactam-binding protein with PASTA domain
VLQTPGTYTATVAATDVTGTAGNSPTFTIIVNAPTNTGTVPNVLGDTSAVAGAAIVAAGFPVGSVTSAPSTEAQLNLVVSQSPAAGLVLSLTTPVSYVLGSGPPTPTPPELDVPELIGQTQLEAQATAAASGYGIGFATSSFSDD